jgi:hypothetical protein
MKKLFALLLVGLSFTSVSKAQFEDRTFRPFKMVFSSGYVRPINLDHKYALNFSIEPKVGPLDWLWIGLRAETSLFVQQSLMEDDYKALVVYALVPHVDFSWPINETFRPFVGLGSGLYASRLYFDGYEQAVDNGLNSHFGFSTRIGFELQRSTFAFEHNFVNKGINYFTIKLGYCIGGGTVN